MQEPGPAQIYIDEDAESVKAHHNKKRRWQEERKIGVEVLTWARKVLQWSKCCRRGCHRMHGRVGAAAEEVRVAAVQPDARERTQLGVAIQEAGRA